MKGLDGTVEWMLADSQNTNRVIVKYYASTDTTSVRQIAACAVELSSKSA
jgi:hypothetical protein